MKPLKKDDLPPEVMEAIEDKLKELYPGFEIKHMGDEAETPPRMVAKTDQLEAKMRDSVMHGLREENTWRMAT
jgi:hypothetical protein